ncbi:MAG: DNA polymerase III subunit chi [Alphaproteobacteria bacterium]|nr:DNA polymerase III subunit chi [Alphaproteobacteria bacterium]
MTEIKFYHLVRRRLEDVLPRMLQATLERDRRRAVVMAGSAERVEALADHLWTYDERGFLPHGTKVDGHAALQPVWLTDADENPNGAEVLFLTDGAVSAHVSGYALVCDIFDGNDDGQVAAARARWTACRDAGHELTHWQETERGAFEKKG